MAIKSMMAGLSLHVYMTVSTHALFQFFMLMFQIFAYFFNFHGLPHSRDVKNFYTKFFNTIFSQITDLYQFRQSYKEITCQLTSMRAIHTRLDNHSSIAKSYCVSSVHVQSC